MSRAGGDKLNEYFSDYIKGKTRRAYSSYYVVQFPHCSVLMSKKVEHDEEKQIIRYRCPNGSSVIFFMGSDTWNSTTRAAAKVKVHKSSVLSTSLEDDYLDLKLLDYREGYSVNTGTTGVTEKYVTSLLFEDAGSNFVMQLLPLTDNICKYEVEAVDETKHYVRLFNYRVPKEMRTVEQAEKYYFEKEYGVDVRSCYKILGALIVPVNEGCEPEKTVVDSDTLERILNPYTGLEPKYVDILRKFKDYLDQSLSYKPFYEKMKITDHPFSRDFFRYVENLKLAELHRVRKSKVLDYLFASAIIKNELPMIDYMRDDSDNEYIRGTFRSDKDTVVNLNKWHRIMHHGGQ